MKILVIDGQGGGVGKQVVSTIKKHYSSVEIMVVGTNSAATSAMLKAGADNGATGENAVIVGCRTANIIIGPIGIVIADSLFGEITPQMALTIGQSNAKRLLIPINHCDNIVLGVNDLNLAKLMNAMLDELAKIIPTS